MRSIWLCLLVSWACLCQGQKTEIKASQLNFIHAISSDLQQSQSATISAADLTNIDWTQIDRRAEQGWWHLYAFGERYFDRETAIRPWLDKQIDLDFFFPYYGFRFNYTFIFNEGFIAFSYPWYIQPPYTYPNPRWPDKPDPSLIAAFMSEQQVQFVGDTRISHVWYRVVERPINLIGADTGLDPRERTQHSSRYYRTYRGQKLKTTRGRLEDPQLLDQITRDVREGMVGARGWTADYALIITWERMSYGGAPKITQLNEYERAKRWQNTYQMVIATDEIRSYVLLNFANINWTSSSSAGALSGGRGGKQSALVGFNGGNGTGYYELPYSAEGNSYKLVQFGSTETAGRWLARVDELIQYGGCTNASRGTIEMSQQYGTMLGGFALNVSGPCFRQQDIVKLQLDELTLDCERINMIVSRCVVPVNGIFRTGLVDVKLSVDGGKNYPWWNKFYILQPGMARRRVNLINDPLERANNWNSFEANNLTLSWDWKNISVNSNALVDITLWGYWEDVTGHQFKQIGYIAQGEANTGLLHFNPQTMRQEVDSNAWRWFHGGVVQVRVADTWLSDRGDGIFWSTPVPFGWYFHQKWQYEYGNNWALQICQKWFDYDGRLYNFYRELEPAVPCPCTLNQALMDLGRFTGLPDCDMTGNHQCYYSQGAQHCVISTVSVWTGAGQMCCYDYEGWLMFSDDYEYDTEYLRFYSAGVPYRAHPWGSFPYKRPPYVPTLSNFYNDLIPYDYCCKWAASCEFFFWRRQTSTCQTYRPPSIAYAYGDPHFVTYDGAKYSFNGKGYYILTMMKSSRHDLMVQVRMEQPIKTLWDSEVRATVITGLAARDNQSAVVQVFARKDMRRWRYTTDVYVDGVRVFFDMSWKKIQTFQGVTLRSPPRNMNMSEIELMFTTGVGIRVQEARGLLNILVALPPHYNHSLDKESTYDDYTKCSTYDRSLGLLGTFNNDVTDDLTTPDCHQLHINYPMSESEARQVYYDFADKWRLDKNLEYPSLFQIDQKPIYNPLTFANEYYEPIFDAWRITNASFWESLIFSRQQVRVACQGVPACEYDYIVTGRREVALDTLDTEKKYEGLKDRGEIIYRSCGPLQKHKGVVKHPPGNNYLSGVTVTFSCKPDYFLHGDQQRTCINGTWSPGWWVWCRKRSEENALKWMTGILSSAILLLSVILTFLFCSQLGKKKRQQNDNTTFFSADKRNQVASSWKRSPVGTTNTALPVVSKVGIFSTTGYNETST